MTSKLSAHERFLVQRALQFVPTAKREIQEQEFRISLSEARHERRMVECAERAALARYPEPIAVKIERPTSTVESEIEPEARMPWPNDYFGLRPMQGRCL